MKRFSSLLARIFLLTAGTTLLFWGSSRAATHVTTVVVPKAFINGKIITLNAPIGGLVEVPTSMNSGMLVSAHQPLLKVTNNLSVSDWIRNAKLNLASEKARLAIVNDQLNGGANISDPLLLTQDLPQSDVPIRLAEQGVAQAEIDVKTAMSQAEAARVKYEKLHALAQEGAFSVLTAQEEFYRWQVLQNQVASAQIKLESAHLQLKEQQSVLAIAQQRSRLPSPEVLQSRSQRLEQLAQQRAELQISIQEKERQIAQIEQNADFLASTPSDGIMWEMLVQHGDQIVPGQPLVQVLDCQQIWVDAFVNIEDLKRIEVGSLAEVEIYANRQTLPGVVKTIRPYSAGSEKLGQDAAVAPPDLSNQQYAQVRIELQDISTLVSHESSSANFCNVGQLAQVKIIQKAPFNPLLSLQF